jgi:hypothetical protein
VSRFRGGANRGLPSAAIKKPLVAADGSLRFCDTTYPTLKKKGTVTASRYDQI